MNFNKVMLASVIALSSVSFAQAAPGNQGSGTVKFFGEIIDAPCSIEPQSVDQSYDMGQVNTRVLASEGVGASQDFTIELKDCDVATLKTVKIAFTGQTDINNTDLLGLAGTASGAGIQLVDSNNVKVKLDGTPSASTTLMNGDNALNFAAYLKGSKTGVAVVPGDFTAVTNFTLAYQ
ncbi:fimbrial protein [Serratia oryzae]|uniref:Fimbria A protein n=1 Tax=Serratia oryzae TaxID=2034155 RepID=A0A1S8CJV0_9GAMM|nr:fimbrial protein [Serratia oryzae]OMQ23687.1 fimbria A protein [Serratia oryzae]